MTSPEPEPAGMQADAFTARQALYAALSVVQGKLTTVDRAKTGEVKGQTKDGKQYSYDYKYADLASIADAVYPLLAANGLAFVAGPLVNGQGRFVLRWQLVHSGGAELTGDYPLPAEVKSPQALGSAITYGRRYCLSAVVGVITADDDGAAAQYADRQQAAREDMTPQDPERTEAVNRVANAWQAQYGELDWAAVSKAFAEWSGGEDSRQVPPGRLRSFAAYLSALPAAEAGSDPAETAAPAEQREARNAELVGPMTAPQRGHLFAMLGEIGIKARQDQLEWMRATLGTDLESRGDLTKAQAAQLIDTLRGGVEAT